MGNAKSIEYLSVSAPSHPGEWLFSSQLPYCTLLLNTDTNYLAQQYIIPKDPKLSLLKTFQIYDYRLKQNHNLVQVYQAEEEPSAFLCQGVQYLRVKTERIPNRLSQFQRLTPEEGMFVLLNSLIGYRTVFEFVGGVVIDDEMVGVNGEGKVKVWISGNFAKNSSDSEVSLGGSQEREGGEKMMVEQVLDVVKGHLEGKEYPADFVKFYEQFNPKTFAATLQFIENYVRHVGMVLPKGLVKRAESVESSIQSIQVNMVNMVNNRRGNGQHMRSPAKQGLIPCGVVVNSVKFPSLAGPPPPQILDNKVVKSSSQVSGIVNNIQSNNQAAVEQNVRQVVVESVGNKTPSMFGSVETIQTGSRIEQPQKQPYTFTFHQIKKTSGVDVRSQSKERGLGSQFGSTSLSSVQKFSSPFKGGSILGHKKPSFEVQNQNPYYVNKLSQPPIKNYPFPQSTIPQPPPVAFHSPNHFSQQPIPEQRVFQQKLIPNGIQPKQSQSKTKEFQSPNKVTQVYISRNRSPPINHHHHQVPHQFNHNPIKQINIQQRLSPRNSHAEKIPVKYKQSTITKLNVVAGEGFQNSNGVIYPKQFRTQQQQENITPVQTVNSIANVLAQGEQNDERYQCTTEIDSVRPEIRKLMMRSSTQQTNPVTQTTPPIPQTQQPPSHPFEPTPPPPIPPTDKQKFNLLQIRQQQIKQYLIGNSSQNPARTLEHNKYYTSLQKQYLHQPPPHSIQKIEEQQQSITFKELDRVMDSLNQSLGRMDESPIVQILTQKKQDVGERGCQEGDETIKIGEFRESCREIEGEDEGMNISEIQTIVQKNSSLIQGHILNQIDQFEITLSKDAPVPTYEELREALRSGKFLGESFNLKSD